MTHFLNENKPTLFFRKWSRKKYAAFSSIHKVVKMCSLGLAYTIIACPDAIFAQTDTSAVSKIIEIDEVEIVGQKSPGIYSQLPRMVEVITREEIENSPSQSIPDVLEFTPGVDIKQRGPLGIQSDIHIRGGSFDHTLILLNGINVSDIQTGHYSLNLPLDLQAVEKIEVLNGPGARVHGTNAFTGAVNIITRKGDERQLSANLVAGDFNYYSGSISAGLPVKNMDNFLSVSYASSGGYIKNTDFKSTSIYYRGGIGTSESKLDFQFGYNGKETGANQYYSPRYPDQYEINHTFFTALKYKTGKEIKLEPSVYWRRHQDEFQLFRLDDDWYRIEDGMTISNDTNNTQFNTTFVYNNYHITDIFGIDINSHIKSQWGTTTLGFEVRSENILSSNIGNDMNNPVPVRNHDNVYYTKEYQRSIADIYIEQTAGIGRLFISGGALINWNTMTPNELNVFPGIDINYQLSNSFKIISSYNYTVGLPTFTDLLYYDPANEGNIDLKPYSMHSVEGGLKYIATNFKSTAIYYYNSGKNVIDWVWHPMEERNKAINIDTYEASGIELSIAADISEITHRTIPVDLLRLSYSYIDMNKELTENVSKYFNLRQKLTVNIQHRIISGFAMSWNIAYQDREGGYFTYDYSADEFILNSYSPLLLVDGRLSWKAKTYEIYAETSNLFDKIYVDAGSLQQPGRWIRFGIKFDIKY
jgi:vitamin B12 transporter